MKPDMLRILLVDDNPATATLTKMLLVRGKIAHVLHHETSASRAVGYMATLSRMPDLAIISLPAPEEYVRHLIRAIRQRDTYQQCWIVICADGVDEADIAEMANLGVHFYVEKPLTLGKLQRVVQLLQVGLLPEARRA